MGKWEMHQKESFSYGVDKNNNVRPSVRACVRPAAKFKGGIQKQSAFLKKQATVFLKLGFEIVAS